MVVFSDVYPDGSIVMLKVKGPDLPGKGRSSHKKIWPFLVNDKEDGNADRLRLHEINHLNLPRTRGPLRSGTFTIRSGTGNINTAESFHCAIAPILGLAQLFGLFPLSGIRSQSPANLRFNKFSFRVLYAVSITTMILVMAIISVIHMIKSLSAETFEVKGGIASATAGAIFYGNSLLGTVLFFWLAPRWIGLQRDWRAMEQYIDSNASDSPHLRWKFFAISAIVLSLALIEHVLSIVNSMEGWPEWDEPENRTIRGFIEFYSHRSHAFILETVQYNFALGAFIFVVSKLATFTWNFTDLFLMLISTGLAERYKSLNKKVKVTVAKNRSGVDWCELREDFASLSAMVKKVDNDVSPIILLSFANNLYFICLQLLNGLSRPGENTIVSTIYFFGSFAFLIGRTCAVTLLTARINDQSRLALPYLYNCSASSYTIETQRLQHQLTTDDISLTGLRFFSITRNFMLAVGGAVVTYEVVLLQFNVAMNH